MTEELTVRPRVVRRHPVHPSITRQQISDLVDTFYGRIRAHDSLGPIFEARVRDNWPVHLAKMKTFWSSVLLHTGEYKGKPVPVHARITEAQTEDFRKWLALFRLTVAETFEKEAQPVIIATAERIASSLWLAMGDNGLKRPPDWSDPAPDANTTTPAGKA